VAHGTEARVAELRRRQADLAVLEQDHAREKATELQQHAALDRACGAVRDAEERHNNARQALDEAATSENRLRDEARFQAQMLTRAANDAAEAGAAGERRHQELAALQAQLAKEEHRVGEWRTVSEEARSQRQATRAALASVEQSWSAASHILRDRESQQVVLRDRLSSAASLVKERGRHHFLASADLQSREEQTQRAAAELLAFSPTLAALGAREAAASAVVAELEARLQPLKAQLDIQLLHHQSVRATVVLAEEQAACCARERERCRTDMDRAGRDLEVLQAQVAATLGCGIEELPLEGPPSGAQARIRILQDRMACFGHINGCAVDDYAAVAERLTFLQTQSSDLHAGVARLRGIIAEANTTVRDRFAATVAELDQHFTRYFTRLFAGGQCKLLASYDGCGLPSGMEVQAQPPGKRTRDMALLSGGERALVALALLFAMLEVRPVPFCLLDEVEASLDESNTDRYGAILRELSLHTQFILITHNRGAMLHADRLYGVTMGETGVSFVVGLDLARLRDEEKEIAG